MKSLQLSITSRLVLMGTFVLIIFFSVSVMNLDKAFRDSARTAQQQRLQKHLYTLLAATDIDENNVLHLNQSIVGPLLSTPQSGLYAQITQDGKQLWQSSSVIGFSLDLPEPVGDKNQLFYGNTLNSNMDLMNLVSDISWEANEGELAYTLHVAEDTTIVNNQADNFKRNLWSLLGATSVILLLIQGFVFHWSLKSLRSVAIELAEIKAGRQQRLPEDYPKEVNQLTGNINTLLDHEKLRRERYKNALADLAHALKTPIAVLQGELSVASPINIDEAQKQLMQINNVMDYQLRRAATTGKGSLLTYTDIRPIIEKICSSLDKVYQQKNIKSYITLPEFWQLHADEDDMYELWGNLLENAYKYTHTQVVISADLTDKELVVRLIDDGDGIPQEMRADILRRGKRADSQIEGQGIGLAISSDIVAAYNGEITITQSTLGGACFNIRLPRA